MTDPSGLDAAIEAVSQTMPELARDLASRKLKRVAMYCFAEMCCSEHRSSDYYWYEDGKNFIEDMIEEQTHE